jgi:thiamine-phosphate pyrophosphorylase
VLVTDRHATGGRELADVVARALDGGLPAVQLREKDLPGRPLLALAERLRRVTADRGALLFVNDRLDVARAVGADGVHLGEESFPVEVARALVPQALIGASVHAAAEATASRADFVFFGPVFATPSKAAFGPPQGTERLAAAVRGAGKPVLAIGGVTAGPLDAVRAAGAHGIAVIRAILAAGDPGAATRALVSVLRDW